MGEQNNRGDVRKRCYAFSLAIIALVDTLPQKRSSWVISDQLIRSGTSIGANLVEARASSSRLEFKKFYEIALKSANETKYWLDLLRDSGLSTSDRTDSLSKEVVELANMIAGAVITLKGKRAF